MQKVTFSYLLVAWQYYSNNYLLMAHIRDKCICSNIASPYILAQSNCISSTFNSSGGAAGHVSITVYNPRY